MANELVPVESNALTIMPAMTIQEALQRRNELVEFTSKILRENEDYGKIPGTEKNTLLKAGAEKLTTFFGLTKKFILTEKEEDWTGDRHNEEPFFFYTYKCQLLRGNFLIAESEGSCNSWEAKYRWRNANRKCPRCGKENIRKSNKGGYYCWTKTDGCGANFQDGDQSIESQPVGKRANPDIFDQVNTIQKMAQKRALIAATLLAVNASEFFTQDMEDFAHNPNVIDAEFEERTQPPKQPAKPKPEPKAEKPAEKQPEFVQTSGCLTVAQQEWIWRHLKDNPDYGKALLKVLGFERWGMVEARFGEVSGLIITNQISQKDLLDITNGIPFKQLTDADIESVTKDINKRYGKKKAS